MSFVDKIMFWKRDDDLLESELKPMSAPEYNPEPFTPGSDNLGLPPSSATQGMNYGQMNPGSAMAPPSPSMPDSFTAMPQPDMPPRQQPIQYREIRPDQPGNSHDTFKEMELISAKLDTLRALMENISTRLDHIEKTQDQKYKW